MPHKIDRSALVMHSAEKMFDLVNDVSSYPAFLPWCSDAEVHSVDAHEMVASLELAKGAVKQRFTTKNSLTLHKEIAIELIEGPFSQLKGVWEFKALSDQACKVVLSLQFEFQGAFGKMALGSVFAQAANTLVDAFCKRANEVYS